MKKTIKNDTIKTIHYVRNASGLLLSVYQNDTLFEQNIYGSSRLAIYKPTSKKYTQTLGEKACELSNHLGNVNVVISDNKYKSGTIYAAFVLSERDYYAYGQVMRWRTHESEKYRYAYNGKELEEDLGKGLTDFGGRILHTWGGFWLSVDPLAAKYPMFSPYVSMGGSPIRIIDRDGKDIDIEYKDENGEFPQTFKYEIGMKYSAKLTDGRHIQAVEDMINMLNDIHKNDYDKVEVDKLKTHKVYGGYFKSLSEKGVNDVKMIDYLMQDNVKLTIAPHEDDLSNCKFTDIDSGGEIKYHTKSGAYFKNGNVEGYLSPLVGMVHELGHAYFYSLLVFGKYNGRKKYDQSPEERKMRYIGAIEYEKLGEVDLGIMKNEKERIVFEYIENIIAKIRGEVVRNSHDPKHNLPYEAIDYNSTEKKQ